ncbi:peroxiredoxin [candidate division KSB1 bacterium]|nr:peroxiredoxin [candidate division KSB1 bacterium]
MKYLIILIVVIGLAVAATTMRAKEESSVKVGDKAPDFKLTDDTGKVRSLSEFNGQKVALYFYPKDDTPGCTKEACSFRDDHDIYAKHGIVVIGVSYDSPESHKKFKEKYNLPFILVSDKDKSLSKTYGAYGKFVAKRYTYLIDETGKVIHVFKDVDVTAHANDVLNAFGISRKTTNTETKN